jgi:hypothetical protein
MIKTYSNKQNAKRAAKAAGLDVSTLSFITVLDGTWTWETTPAEQPAPKAPRYKLHFRKPKAAAPAPVAAPVAPAPAAAKSAAPPAKTFEVYGRSSVLSPVALVHQYLDKLVAEGKVPVRKDALYALSQMGVNRFTASTQYQRWTAKRAGK